VGVLQVGKPRERTQQKPKNNRGSIRSQDAVWDEKPKQTLVDRAKSAARSNPKKAPDERNKVVSKVATGTAIGTAIGGKRPTAKKKATGKKKAVGKRKPNRTGKGKGPTGTKRTKRFLEVLEEMKSDILNDTLKEFINAKIKSRYNIGDNLLRDLRTELRVQKYLKKKGRGYVVTKPIKPKLALVN